MIRMPHVSADQVGVVVDDTPGRQAHRVPPPQVMGAVGSHRLAHVPGHAWNTLRFTAYRHLADDLQ